MAVSSLHSLFLLLVMMIVNRTLADDELRTTCREARCGEYGPPIRFPFRLKDSRLQRNSSCSYPGFDLFCVGNQTAINLAIMPTKPMLLVRKIDYKSQQIHVYNNSSCLPLLLLSGLNNRSIVSPFQLGNRGNKNSRSSYTQLKCTSRTTCSTLLIPSDSMIELYQQGLLFCTKINEFESVPDEIYKLLALGYRGSNIPISWSKPDCRHCEAKGKGCRLKKDTSDQTECFLLPKGKPKISPALRTSMIATSVSLLLLVMVASSFYLYNLRKKDRENSERIEKFLEDYNALKPSRYTYADIKKITNQFKDMLGQGAYGTVFKGKLSNDVLVAVKILHNSSGNGEDFINEVATMSQIYHVNVVRLVGYCADGFRRALIYEYLPNDSLEKYISSAAAGGKNPSLSWEKLQEIGLGIAKGIEYLHQGCDKRILHFDIKPHNVLLDHNFVPKISDFGLAKLCSKDKSEVPVMTARGTIGYIAPEVISKNFGNVSYKSDVYSFGMLLLEMVGGRKNINDTDQENNDEIYYPQWIYNLLEDGEELRILIEGEEDAKIAKKLAIVGLWCIQWHPAGRPTMKIVVQMLEGEKELAMPPNPFTSAGDQSSTNSKQPARPAMALELEVIPE